MRPVRPVSRPKLSHFAFSHVSRHVAARLIASSLSLLLSLVAAHPALHAEDAPQNVSAAQLRRMTAAQFQAGIDKEGARAFTMRLTREDDPHNWDEPRYDMILNHISTGQAAWLRIAAEIGPYTVSPYTTEPNFTKGLNVALAYALLENPAGVIRMRHADEHFMNACAYPFPQPSDAFVHHYQQRALLALKRVHDPALKAQAEDCRRELLSPPTEKASN